MTSREPLLPNPEVQVTTEYLGVIQGELGQRGVFLSRHFKDDEEVYSMATLIPVGPSMIARAAHERQQQQSDAVETPEN